jgi:hypothetical protein
MTPDPGNSSSDRLTTPPAPPAQTCEAIVEREWSDARRGGVSWPADLRHVNFAVRSVRGSTAKAELKVKKPYGPTVEFTLRNTPNGWRIDDSDAVPEGY